MNYKRLLELILINLDEGIIVTDAKANITFYKEPAGRISGIDGSAALGKNILEVFPDLTAETSTFYQVIKSRKPLIEHIQHYTNYQGKKVSTVTSTMPIIENGELCGCFEIFKDLTQVMELSEKITRLQEQLYKKPDAAEHPKGVIGPNGTAWQFEHIVCASDSMKQLKERAAKIADSASPVLVYGETGTGKELLVQAIHNAGRRRAKPFIAQNCAALPFNLLESILFGTASGSFTGAKDNPGLFELADGGTLFLDEINSMDIELQAKLLRVLQDGVVRRIGDIKTRRVNVRVMASTNQPTDLLLEKKMIREDLFYRLNAIYLEIPPLRARKEDIMALTDYFIQLNNRRLKKRITGVSEEVRQLFLDYSWPGNVRELEHLVESSMNFSENKQLTRDDISYDFEKRAALMHYHKSGLPHKEAFELLEGTDLGNAVAGFEKKLIVSAIDHCGGNYSKAARQLNIPKQTLHNKIKKYGIRLKVDGID